MDRRRFVKSVGCAGTLAAATQLPAGASCMDEMMRLSQNRPSAVGMGYVVLDKDKTFAEQMTQENTIYEIRYDFDLGGETEEIPAGCVLKFEGGSLKNGTIVSNNTFIDASDDVCIFVDVNLIGLFLNDYVSVCWFGANNSYYKNISENKVELSRIDCCPAINAALSTSFKKIYFPKGAWYVSGTITLDKEVELLLSGKSDSTPLNYKVTSMGFDLNEACIFTDKDISLLTTSENLVSSLRLAISGGSFDVSLIKTYTNAVIHLKSNCNLWGIELNTAVLGKLNSINDGIGLYFDATISTGHLSYIRTNCIVKYFGTGIKVKGTETQKPSWITDFVDRSEIMSCRQSLYVEYCEEAFIEGHYQQTYIFEAEENNIAAVYLKTRFATINCTVWDCHLQSGGNVPELYVNKWTNRYAFELDSAFWADFDNYTFLGNSMRYVNNGLVKDHTNMVSDLPKYQAFNRSQYTKGYSDTDNWFVKRPEFTATYESNCNVVGFDNLFLPCTSSVAIIKSAGVPNPYLNITLDINKQGVSVLLMGVVLDIVNSGTFTKAELIRTTYITDVNTGVKEHRYVVDIVPAIVSHYKAIYLNGFEGLWRNTSKIEIRLFGYIGTGNVALLSVFGKIRGKESAFLTCAGGTVYGHTAFTSLQFPNGNSSARPIGEYMGEVYFDTTLGKPIWWNGTAWVDANGTVVE